MSTMKNWKSVPSFGYFVDVYEADGHELRLWQKDGKHKWQLINDSTRQEIAVTDYFDPINIIGAQTWAGRLIDGENPFPRDDSKATASMVVPAAFPVQLPKKECAYGGVIVPEEQKKLVADDGWIEHIGNECPIDPQVECIVKLGNGMINDKARNGGQWVWNYGSDHLNRITHYKITKDAPKENESEQGTPKVTFKFVPVHDENIQKEKRIIANLTYLTRIYMTGHELQEDCHAWLDEQKAKLGDEL